MEQDVSEMVNRTRGEGVDRMIKLKKKYGCTKDNDGLTLTQLKVCVKTVSLVRNNFKIPAHDLFKHPSVSYLFC